MKKRFAFCALAVITVAAAAQALKAADALCPLGQGTLRGTYMVIGGGIIVGVGPASAVGTIILDGKGNSVNAFTVSVNGMISQGLVTGPYTVNSDCRGILTQSDGTHYDQVMAPDGSRFNWIETDTGTVLSGTAIRMSDENVSGEASTELSSYAPAATTLATTTHGLKAADADALCPLGNATLRGAYVIVGTGPGVTTLGAYDGKENSVNTYTASRNGDISRGIMSGPYTVNRDCTGSINLSGGNYSFVVSPDGSRVNWIDTDAGSVFSGTELRLGNSSELKE
jgi:hypothetical protein